jgi:hypothetical protein
MPAAFEPDVTEKGIEGVQAGIGPHLEMQPIWPVPIDQQVQDFRLAFCTACRDCLKRGLTLLAGAQVSGHGAFAERPLAKGTGACRCLSGHDVSFPGARYYHHGKLIV